jgi:prenylcysteine oxidase/farnesylcysteine lyase
MINQYVGLYSKEAPRWDNIAQLSALFGWIELTASSTMEYLLHKGVSRRYISELVEGATRANYGQVNYIIPSITPPLTSLLER